MDNQIKRVKIPNTYEYMGEFEQCPYCKEESFVYGDIWQNDDGGIDGNYLCTNCECTWSKS